MTKFKRRNHNSRNKRFFPIQIFLIGIISFLTISVLLSVKSYYSTSKSTISPISTNYRCTQVYFWGGVKAGSTSLFSLLTTSRSIQSTPRFSSSSISSNDFINPYLVDIGKEPCIQNARLWNNFKTYALSKNICGVPIKMDSSISLNDLQNNNQEKIMKSSSFSSYILNGCPFHHSVDDAKTIHQFITSSYNHQNLYNDDKNNQADAFFLMLIRDPVDRLVSHLNQIRLSTGQNYLTVEDRAKSLLKSLWDNQDLCGASYNKLPLQIKASLYGCNLENWLQVFAPFYSSSKIVENMLIIPIESLSRDPENLIKVIREHIGNNLGHDDSNSWSLLSSSSTKQQEQLNVNKSNERYQTISDTTRDRWRNIFRKDVLKLERLIGKRFVWSHWAHQVYDDIDNRSGDIRDSEVVEYHEEKEEWLVANPLLTTSWKKDFV